MKMSQVFASILVLGVLGAFLAIPLACGTTNPTPTPTPTSSTITISGSLKTGTVAGVSAKSAGGIKVLASAAGVLANYNIVAVSKETGKVYVASTETDAAGNFSIPNLPSSESYYIEVLDLNYKLIAPIAFGTSSSKAVMAVSPNTANLNLGEIAYDSTKNAAVPTIEPASYLDQATSVEVKSGETIVPKGAGNYGKGSVTEITSGTYDNTKSDGDKDGLPNFFDADNNGDLVPDEFDGLYTSEAMSAVLAPNFFPYAFTNLKVDYDRRDTFKTAYSDFTIAIGVSGNSGAAKTIQSVKVVHGPAWIAKATIVGSSTFWSANSYAVPLKSSSPEKVFEVQVNGIKPLTDVNAGDTLTFEITYTDATTEKSMKMLNFVFTDIPRVTAYKFASGAWQTSMAASGPIATATTTEVTLRWTRPKDESSREITGAKYTFEYNVIGGTVQETTIITKDSNIAATSLEGYCNFSTLSNINLSTELFIGVCIRSIANDNSAENIRFTKGW